MAPSSQFLLVARLGATVLSLVFATAACDTGSAPSQAIVAPAALVASAVPSAATPTSTPSPSSRAISSEAAPFQVASCSPPTKPPSGIETGPDVTIPRLATLTPMEAFSTDNPQGLAVADGSVWTANESLDTVTRIDVTPGEVTSISVAPGIGPQWVVEAAGAVWSAGAGGLVRIDVENNAVDQRVSGCVGSLVSAFGSLWGGVTGGLIRVDPRTFAVEEVHPDTGAGVKCKVSAAADSVWLSCGAELSRIDPSSNSVRATVTTNGTYATVIAAAGAAWVITGLDPFSVQSREDAFTMLERFDLETNDLVPGTKMRLVHGAFAGGRLVDGSIVWLSTSFGVEPGAGKLYAFEPASGKVVSAFDISEGRGYGSNAIAFGYGSLWTASGTANAVRRFPRPNP